MLNLLSVPRRAEAMKRVRRAFLVSALILGGVGRAQAGTSYNNATDFSPTSNPNGVWSYGYLAAGSTPNSSTFTLYGNNGTVAGGIEYWNIAGGNLTPPEIFYNPSSSVVSFSTITMQPNQAAFHPGPNDEYSDYRFIAPVSGSYSLTTLFTGIDTVGTTTDVHVLDNGTLLFSANINGYLATSSFNTSLSLTAGDLVDFAVGFGSNGNYFFDSTALDAILTLNAATVPEPSCLALLGIASCVLVGYRRRKRIRLAATD